MTASDVITNSAEVPGVIWSRVRLMKASSIPTSASEPDKAPVAAPIAAPSRGTKKIRPKSRPQKAPPRAPAPVRLLSCCVLGFFLPLSQETVAASWTTMTSSRESLSRVLAAASAPSGVSNFQTVSVAMIAPWVWWPGRVRSPPSASGGAGASPDAGETTTDRRTHSPAQPLAGHQHVDGRDIERWRGLSIDHYSCDGAADEEPDALADVVGISAVHCL